MIFQLYRLHAYYAVLVPRLAGRCHNYYVIVALTSVAPGLLDVYKEEIDVFSNKLVSILSQNSKYNYAINLEEGKTLL
jgi:hypothetical protein